MMGNVKVLQEIEKHWLDKIVELAETTMRTSKVYGKRCKNGHWNPPSAKECAECKNSKNKGLSDILQRSQLSNLQNMASSTDSVEALKLFIRYQMGRKEGKGWKYKGSGEREFGFMVIDDFNKLREWSEEIVKRIGISESEDEDTISEVHLHLIRLYCGFLIRWFVALKGAEEVETTGEE